MCVRVHDCVCACLCVSFVGIGVCVSEEGRCAVNRQETPEVAVGKAIYTPIQWGDGLFYFNKEQRDRGEETMCNRHTAVDRQRTPTEAASSTYSIERHKMTVNKPLLSSLHRLDLPVNIILSILFPSPPPKYFFSKYFPLFLLWFISSSKGSHPLRKVQFFLTLFKRPLTPPPPPFVWTLCGEFFWRNFNKSAETPVATIIYKITLTSMVKMLNLTLYLGHF